MLEVRGRALQSSIVAAIGYLTLLGYFMAGIANLFFSSVHLDSHGFESRLQPLQMIGIYLSNSILVVITLGLFTLVVFLIIARMLKKQIWKDVK